MKLSKESKNKILTALVIVALLIIIMVLLCENIYLNNLKTDSEKFYEEYSNIPVDNVFEMVSTKEALELLFSEQAIVLFGFKDCKWCRSYVPILNEVVTENKVPVVYYCNIKQDRKNNTEEYKNIVAKLSEYLYEDEEGNKRVYVPDVYFIKDGKIIGHNNDTSTIEGADTEAYYTEEATNDLKQKLTDLILKVYPKEETSNESCDDSKKGC